MSFSGGGIGLTLTGGIQDIAAILPLLGTQQCSIHVSSALTRGYLYAASAPMSIFGSLGVVSAGFKTFVACVSFRDIEGARILGNMGFEPQGENLSLIMVEGGKGKNRGCYVIETRMDDLIEELNIDRNRITGVSHKSAVWNIKMMATTALLQHCSIHLFKSGCQQAGLEEKYDMGVPGSALYWRLHHSHTHSTSHTTTNNHSFRPIPCRTRPATEKRCRDDHWQRREVSNDCAAHCTHMALAIPSPYRSLSVCCGICWMF